MQIPFRDLPGIPALFLDYVSNWEKVRGFYRHPYSLEAIVAFARRRAEAVLPHREALCAALAEQQRAWGGNQDSVDKLRRGAVVVVAGQQPGLFTGPMYTVLKAITAIKLARAVSEAGTPAVPVFWIASEDHDYQEIESAFILDRDAAVQRLQVDLANSDVSPVGWLHFKDDVTQAIGQCLSSLPQSEFLSDLRTVLESSYVPERSPVDAFARMMVQLFGSAGLILADPLAGSMRGIGESLMRQALARNADLRQAALSRSRAVAAAGYSEQVKVDSSFTGLFALRGKSRQALKAGEIEGVSGPVSANVLLRPVLQDTIFPTAAFVGGPAEVSYLAQAAAVYETLDREMPPIYPRISATVIEQRVAKVLRKYSFQFQDFFQGKDLLKRKAVEGAPGIDSFRNVKSVVADQIESLRPTLQAVDPTLLGALDTARQKIAYQMETLETRFVNAEAKRNDIIEKQLDLAVHSLFPDKKLQERHLNISSFAARYGLGFVKLLEEKLLLDSTQHQLIEI